MRPGVSRLIVVGDRVVSCSLLFSMCVMDVVMKEVKMGRKFLGDGGGGE